MRNSGECRGGHGIAIRNNPRFSSSECEPASPCGRSGQFDPSIAANTGSLPSVSFQRSCSPAAETDIASAG